MPTETTEKPKNGEKQDEPIVGPQKQPPTPLVPPVIMYNTRWRVAPLVVETQEELDALDPAEWIQDPANAAKSGDKPPAPHWPKLYANINVPPIVIGGPADLVGLSSAYREFTIPEGLAKAATDAAADAKKADDAKAADAKKHDQAQKPPVAPQPQHK